MSEADSIYENPIFESDFSEAQHDEAPEEVPVTIVTKNDSEG